MPANFTNYSRYQALLSSPRSKYLLHQVKKHWYKPASILAIGAFISHKDFSIDLQFNARPDESPRIEISAQALPSSSDKVKAMNTSMFASNSGNSKLRAVNVSNKASDDNRANTYSNLNFKKDKFAGLTKEQIAKRKKQLKYVEQYAETAQAEMKKYGIPASIKLAQGLLESNVGESPLAQRNNNHFGIKCFSRTCHKGHCSNFSDDSHKDFFRKYKSAWESYRAHSQLLQNKRYKHLAQLGSTNYKDWANGLKKAGYATDKRYAPKIIRLIEDLELYKYDY